MDQTQDVSLDGWNIVRADDAEWVPWTGSDGEARAKVLGSADGYMVMLVEAQPGYVGSPHEHGYAECAEMRGRALRRVFLPVSDRDHDARDDERQKQCN